ncbi:MAG: FeoA family protein [Rhodococcus sp. (in: high G+C Gram-positive bacteria)]|uniref:FeoA family protein n=1 Tax=Rhodococcus sp. TaxID=1831 RepID=UPI003BAFA069
MYAPKPAKHAVTEHESGRLTLADLPPGQSARITDFDSRTPEAVATRLRHLGFRAGTVIVHLRTAPLGDPSVYRLLGYEMCLRRREARHIRIAQETASS